jgi:aminomethyltransferase
MPSPTPFHPRTAAACTSLSYKIWAGCWAVRAYDTQHGPEYFALRHAAGLIDVSPLYKYEVHGPDAGALLARMMVRDPSALAVGRVSYLCWCDDDGKVLDDGTVTRLERERWRVTSAEPAGAWLARLARGWQVTIEDRSRSLAALAVQGPTSRGLLEEATRRELGGLRFFRHQRARIGGAEVEITRTGYTGDLGYEVWVRAEEALAVWDALAAAAPAWRARPVGLDAMDVTRIEAGFILNGVDYVSAQRCLVDARKSTPFEIGLGWTVALDRAPFIGQRALRAAAAGGPARVLVGLVYDWDEYEATWAEFGLPPQVPAGAWRTPVPVYAPAGPQVGYATSGTWSPQLKANLALATVDAAHAHAGARLRIEVTPEFSRRLVGTTVTNLPFFEPERKRA